jgi:hypothetical protein
MKIPTEFMRVLLGAERLLPNYSLAFPGFERKIPTYHRQEIAAFTPVISLG